MRFYQPNISYRMRWLVLAAWWVCAVVYVSWLFEPPVVRHMNSDDRWMWPSAYLRLTLHAVFGLFQDPRYGNGLYGVFGFEPRIATFVFPLGPIVTSRDIYLVYSGVWLAGLVGMSWLFLPRGRERESMLPARRRPTHGSVIAAVLGASVSTVSAACIAVEGYIRARAKQTEWLPDFVNWISSHLSQLYPPLSNWVHMMGLPLGFVTICVLAVGWTPIVLMAWRRREVYWQYERMTAWLMGTNAGLICIAVFIHSQLSTWERDNAGTYTALALSSTILLWAWACRIRLLFLLRQYESQPPESTCHACGYDLRGTLAAGRKQCPECGAAVLPQLLSANKATGNTNRA